jgi:rhodanese-related sulfurtransferase
MNTITKEKLKAKLEQSNDFILLMCMSEEQFRQKHIPNSRCFNINGSFKADFSKEHEIIVYCSGNDCRFSVNAYNFLTSNGYSKVFHYPGGLAEWEQAGYPVEAV